MIPLADIQNLREMCFSFDGQDGTSFTLATDRLVKDPRYKALEIVLVPVTEYQAKFCFENNGVEIPQLKITYGRFLNKVPYEPITVLLYDKDQHIIADGNHRYVAAFMTDHTDITARIVPRELWEEYIIEVPSKLDIDMIDRIQRAINGA